MSAAAAVLPLLALAAAVVSAYALVWLAAKPSGRRRASWRETVRRNWADVVDGVRRELSDAAERLRRADDDDLWSDIDEDDLPRDEQRVVGVHRARPAQRAEVGG